MNSEPAFYDELKNELGIKDNNVKLNIGCGHLCIKGYVNLDAAKLKGVDVVHDLEKIPYPFEDNTFDEIYCRHIMEHLTDVPKILDELWRISKDGAKITIIVPHLSTMGGWTDLTHKHLFGYNSLDYVAKTKLGGECLMNEYFSHEYSDGRFFNITRIDIEFARWERLLGVGYLANKYPGIWEGYFYNFFPARGIEFELEVIKE